MFTKTGPSQQPSYEPYLNALERNQAKQQKENGKTIEALEKKVEILEKGQDSLLNRIALLEAQVLSERAHAAAVERALQDERKRSEEMNRLTQKQQEELIQLRKRDDCLEKIEDIVIGLEKIDWAGMAPNYSTGDLSPSTISYYQQIYRESYRNGFPRPDHLNSLIEQIKKAPKKNKDLSHSTAAAPSFVIRSNPMPIPKINK